MKEEGINKGLRQVEEFHKVFNHKISDKPICLIQDSELKNLRYKLMKEELEEFKNANTITDQVDALGDLLYVTFGTLVSMGIKDIDKIFDMIHEANLSKVFPDGTVHYNDYGKVVKPDTFIPPDEKIKKYLDSLR